MEGKFGFNTKYGGDLKVTHIDGTGLLSGHEKIPMEHLKLLSEHAEHREASFVGAFLKSEGIFSMIQHNQEKMPSGKPFEFFVKKEQFIQAYKLYKDLIASGKVSKE